jgi:hypothetical protein
MLLQLLMYHTDGSRGKATCQDSAVCRLTLGAFRLEGNNMKNWAKRKEE